VGLRERWKKLKPAFERGRLALLYPLWDAVDTILFTTGRKTTGAPHVRDSIDLKRLMIVVVLALTPCVFMAMWNTGYQANLALHKLGIAQPEGWRGAILAGLGIGFDPGSFVANLLHGLLWFLPLYIVTMAAGGFWEGMFAFVRRHEINEGFLVTGLLFPLTLPPGTPLWQAAIGISFGVVVGKELFGGTGRNFLNPALAARAFLYFAYPQNLSGDSVWTAVDTYTRATPLTAVPQGGLEALDVSWTQAFIGVMPGSLGETSVVACLVGALVLVVTGIGSWRIMVSMLLGCVGTAYLFNAVGSESNPMFQMSPEWHLVVGGLAFGLVFMATDPVSAAQTNKGRWAYGFLIGVLTILIRVVNPAYPESVMLAILLGNVFAPLIDYFVIQANIKRRIARSG
jgi:Na+-transporting NADH:ubiquinone oxidoreductase subunit B